jgi:CheY-like chemotaxis protein
VEDEDASACLVRCALEEANIPVSVYRVCDGKEALAFLRKCGQYEIARTRDIVLLDLNMPRMDGWAVLGEMQQSASLSTIPVVVLTTSSSRNDRERAEQLGARRYMTKPSSFDGLVAGIQAICDDYLRSWRDATREQ